MALADRLNRTADDYEQRSAHHAEKAELGGPGELAEMITANVWAGVAAALREIVLALQEEEAEDLAA